MQYPTDNKMLVQSQIISEEQRKELQSFGCKLVPMGSKTIVMFPSEWSCNHQERKAIRKDGKILQFAPHVPDQIKIDSIFFGVN